MSNIFSGMKEVNDVNTPESAEFKQLLNMKLAAELTKFHEPILTTIMEDPNEEMKETIQEELHVDERIALESNASGEMIRANILTKDNQRTFYLDLTTKDDPGLEQITKGTYDKLIEYVQDPILVMQNVKETLQDNAI